ncbi:MAG: exodeoxyribonuclease VII large subunit [Thermoflexales bacterium]|nr:exodeoxyribonuclease VII large subunit [Thermoflexales bacterium]
MQSTSACPSCGRHTGPYEACPYCGARLVPRISLRVFRYGSLLVALAGLAVLWFFSHRSAAPTVKIGQAQATMNFAYVRVVGHVTRSPSYDPASAYLSFWIEDDSGQMLVSSYRGTTQELVQAGRVPDVGDEISLEGTLRIRDESPSLTLASAETLRVLHPQPAEREIGDITTSDALAAVTVRGQVRQIETPYEGLTLITLRDSSGAIDVAVSRSTAALMDAEGVPELTPGDSVELSGAVTLYENTPQITLTTYGHLLKLDEPLEIAPLRQVRDLTAGRYARVEGELIQLKPFSAGVKLTLDDGSGRVSVLVWNDVYTALDSRADFVEGAIVSVQGQVTHYRGELELVADAPADLELVWKSAAAQAPQQMPIGAITAAERGRTVSVSGVVLESRRLLTGLRLLLGDETGQIMLLLWDDVLSQAPDRDRLGVGARLNVQARVDIYRDELELIPRQGTDLIVSAPVELAQAAPPTAATPGPEGAGAKPVPTPTLTLTPVPPTATASPEPTARALPAAIAIGAASRDRLGQTLTVQGRVVDVTSSSAGVKFYLDDGSGRIDLFVSSGVYRYVKGRAGLRLGAQVLASGELAEYKGALEIVPRLGENVFVLEGGTGQAAEPRLISSLVQEDKDRFVSLRCTILAKELLAGGVKLRVRDEGGDIDLVIWDNVLIYVPDVEGLVEGARLTVTGKVSFFRGAPQLTPQVGYDVQVE